MQMPSHSAFVVKRLPLPPQPEYLNSTHAPTATWKKHLDMRTGAVEKKTSGYGGCGHLVVEAREGALAAADVDLLVAHLAALG